jgi:hypothetical protein
MHRGCVAGTAETRQCIVALQRGALWLLLGSEPIIELKLPVATPITASQLLHFPQPPISFEEEAAAMQVDEGAERGSEAFTFSPDETDDQFGAASRRTQAPFGSDRHARCCMADLGSMVHVSHAHGSALLVHFACGANVQLAIELRGASELVRKCFVALHSALLPTQMFALLRTYHRCAPQAPCDMLRGRLLRRSLLLSPRDRYSSISRCDCPAQSIQPHTRLLQCCAGDCVGVRRVARLCHALSALLRAAPSRRGHYCGSPDGNHGAA